MQGLVRIDLEDYNELLRQVERAEHRFNTLADFILGDLAWACNGPYITAEPVLALLGQWDLDVEGAIEEAKRKRESWAGPLPIPEDLAIDDDFEIPLEWQPTDDEIRAVRERCGDD